jgi:geranylgeranyl reductase family protein
MTSLKTIDVAVVGGGPAGATAAYLIANHGLQVAVIDKCVFPRPKLCAGLITWKTVDLLNRLYGYSLSELKSMGIITHACKHYRIYLHRQELVRGQLDFPFHFVDRKNYDHFWLQTAQNAGAELIFGQKVIGVDPKMQIITLDSGLRIQADVIIGADGTWSKVRQAVYPDRQFNKSWLSNLAMTIESRGPSAFAPFDDQFASLHFGHVPWGYAWRLPNPNRQIVGIGALVSKSHSSIGAAFNQFLNTIDQPPEQLDTWQGHGLPFGNYLDPPARGRILLVGDACGLADPLLGEGIYYAHRSGQLAARAVISAGSQFIDLAIGYRHDLNRHVLRELRWIKFYRNALHWGGRRRRFRGLQLFFRLIPKRLEDAVHGKISFARLLLPN